MKTWPLSVTSSLLQCVPGDCSVAWGATIQLEKTGREGKESITLAS